jgi:hypothetical protein
VKEAKVSAVTHPIRARLVLTLMGRELTTQQIAALLPDIPIASLYRHIRELTQAGVFVVVRETAVRGTVEKTLALSHDKTSYTQADLLVAGHDEFLSLVGSFLSGFLGVFQAYLAKREDGLAENVLFRFNSVNMTDEEFDQFRTRLTDLLSSARQNALTPGRRRRLIGLIGVPNQPEPLLSEEGGNQADRPSEKETHHDA